MSSALKLDKKDSQKPLPLSDVGAVRREVMSLLLASEFSKAIHVLKSFTEKDFVYPSFKLKAERYINHAIDLILAIESNRKFSDLSSLTRSKQQELKEKFNKHNEELKLMLDKVELAYNDLRIKDSRSTHYLVRSTWFSILIVSVSLFFFEAVNGILQSAIVVIESGIDHLTDALAQFL